MAMKQISFPLNGETYLVNDIHHSKVNGKVTGYKITSYNRYTLVRLQDRCSDSSIIQESDFDDGLYVLTTPTLDPCIIHIVDRHVALAGEMAIEFSESSMDFDNHPFY